MYIQRERGTNGVIAICSDCKHVVDMFSEGVAYMTTTLKNHDVWTKLEFILEDR